MDSEGVNLLTLPQLALESLIDYFDPDDLLLLRLVCKTIKFTWVEQPKILRRIQLTITSEEAFTEITKSNTAVPWSNFKFNWESVFIRPKLLPKFLKKFNSSIRIFDFAKCACDDHYTRNDSIIDIILACPNLDILRVCELSCNKITMRNNGLEIIKTNWKHLKYLQIKQVLCTEYHGLDYFGEILANCDSLEELDPPLITISSPEYLSFNYKLFFKNYVVKPIIKYLKCRPKHRNLKKLHIQEYLFDGDLDLLFELAETCFHSGTILYPETFLPFSRSMFLKLPEAKGHILQALGSLGGINDLTMTLAKNKPCSMENLEFLSVSFRSFFISDGVLDDFDVPLFSNLQDMEIEMTNDPPWNGKPSKLSVFMKKLSSRSRPNVKRLNLVEVSRANDTTMIRAVDICKGFPCLRKLEVTNWDAENSEFLTLWKGLVQIQEIQLRFCHNLNDEGIVGPDVEHPAILQLKGLKILSLNDIGTITDLSYVYVFRHLKLKKFYHYTSAGSMVTKVGYNSLAKGEFRESIQEMMIQCSSEFKEMDQFCKFLQQFQKLRKPQFENYAFQPIPQKNIFNLNLNPSASRSCCYIC